MSKTERISNSTARISWRKQVELSFYDERIVAFFSEIDAKQFHFVDGENIINQPWVEFEKIEEFLGVEKIVSKKKFLNTIKKNLLRFQKVSSSMKPKAFIA